MDIHIMKSIPLFKGLPLTTLEDIRSILKERSFARGETLFTEGELGQGLWILRTGAIKLVKVDLEGREQLLKTVRPPEVFSEVVLFDGGPYPVTAQATERSTVSVLYNQDAEALLQEHPSLSWHFLQVLSRRLRVAQERIRILGVTDVTQKLAAILIHLSDEQKSLTLVTSHQDLANMIGTARETVSRALRGLSEVGILSLRRNKVILADKRILQEIAQG